MGIVACMTMDWMEANDSISSATNAAVIEAVPERIRTINPVHRGVSVWRHSEKDRGQAQAYRSQDLQSLLGDVLATDKSQNLRQFIPKATAEAEPAAHAGWEALSQIFATAL